jgi:hypothetical protein
MSLFSMAIGLERNHLLEVFDRAISELDQQEFSSRELTNEPSKPILATIPALRAVVILPPKDNQPIADNAYWINIKPLIDCYPKQPPASTLCWMMQSVIDAPECDQLHWFAGLDVWRNNFHNSAWADEVIKRLVHCQIEEPQPVQSTRKDFELAKQMFGGRVISQATCGVITQ